MDFLTAVLSELPEFNQIKNLIEKPGVYEISGCVNTQKEQLMSALSDDFKFCVIISSDEQKCREIEDSYSAFDTDVMFYPAIDPMFFKADLQGTFILQQRLEVIRALTSKDFLTVVTTPPVFAEMIASPKKLKSELIVIKKGDEIDEKNLALRLTGLGYENVSQAETHGEFSIRGNIIDIFPFGSDAPYRIDLWGNEAESIFYFDPESQRSIEEVFEFTIFPGADSGKKDASLMDYFEVSNTLFIIDEPVRVFEENDLSLINNLVSRLEDMRVLLFSALGRQSEPLFPRQSFEINVKSILSYNGRLKDLVSDLKKKKKDKWRTVLCAATEARAGRLLKELHQNDITAYFDEKGKSVPKPSSIMIICRTLRAGFEYPDIKVCVMSETDIFGKRRALKKKKRRYSGDIIKDFTDLNIGDYVVHAGHGIGIYRGIERIAVDHAQKDFMKVEYAKGANLYVPATQLDRIQKYAAEGSAAPKLSRLGGKEWANTKARVKEAVKETAEDLVKLYAKRAERKGHAYPSDTEWQREFEERFEFEPTEDQLRAIKDIKRDMESPRIMERLICGDVGFGKTEVAIRAAFKAVEDSKQVAFLTPTTILAQQHFNTVSKRMAGYPVNVRMLSRFVSASGQKEILKELADGSCDIVVGTHRLLSDDIKFKDLGLLIIDEEQRFGVTHKEKIKRLKEDVDVLMLSATPIPRTLHMSLSGIRDMSLLSEPPVDRIPIQTYVMEYSDEAVKEAIEREAKRGGQVYYVYNRIDNIDYIADKVSSLVPDLNVVSAHGRMSAKDLEDIMYDFTAGEIDVLVSTTIIETGLDISNVNTIIIHDADRFGLAQLYQLRGRVGRGGKTAYAFLMYRKDRLLREVAENRLRAIREFSDLGSGVKIAMKDLEIRGAGNVLGSEQSGHMEAVGYELYCKLLNQAVKLFKGEEIPEEFETSIDLEIDGYIPSEYIKDEFVKLGMYKKIASVANEIDLDDIRSELKDRFGPIPKPTEDLLLVSLMKDTAHSACITDVSGKGDVYKFAVFKNAKVETLKMPGFLESYGGRVKFVNALEPYFIYKPEKRPANTSEIKDMIEEFAERFGKILKK